MQNIRRRGTEERRKGLKGGYEETRKGRMLTERKEERTKAEELERKRGTKRKRKVEMKKEKNCCCGPFHTQTEL